MESFGSYVNAFNNLVWSDALVYLCLITGVYFTVRMKFPQIRLIKDMVRLLIGKGSQSGISSFQAFATTVGSRSRSEERRVGKECRSRWSPYH